MDLCPFDFQDRAFRPGPLAFRFAGQRAQFSELERRQVDFKLTDFASEGIVIDQRRAIQNFGRCDIAQTLNPALGTRDTGDTGPLVREQEFRISPALVLFAHTVFNRHTHIGQPDFVDFVSALDRDDRAHFDARCVHVDQNEGNAFLWLGSIRISPAQEEAPVGMLSERRPGFLTIDHIMIAIPNGRGFQAGEVRTSARLGITLAPPLFTRQDFRQVARFLLFIAERVDHGCDHRDAERQRHHCINARIFF